MGQENSASDEMRQFFEDYAGDYYAARVLRFFAEYPGVSFNRLAIIHSLDLKDSRQQICGALARLTEQGLLSSSADNNTVLYCLSGDDAARHLVTEFGRVAAKQPPLLTNRSL